MPELTWEAIKAGLIVPKGKTPHATMSAALYERAKSDPLLVKLEKPGCGRAMRGSVRWTLRDSGRV